MHCPIVSSVTYQEREAVGLVDRLDGGEGVDEPRVRVRVAFLHDHVGWLVLVHLFNEKALQGSAKHLDGNPLGRGDRK